MAVDPATKSHENMGMTAFIMAGRGFLVESMCGHDQPRGYPLHAEQDRYTPAMKRAARLYHEHRADCVVIEANNGGDYLPALLEQVDPTVNWRIVHATRGKRWRPRRRSCTSRLGCCTSARRGCSWSWRSR